MGTLTKGNAAESAVLNGFVRRGFDVLVPFGEGQPYDLVVHLPGNHFLRVQCKNARWDLRLCRIQQSDYGSWSRPTLVSRLADAFGVFEVETGAVYVVPVADAPGYEGRLRVRPTRNNQRLKVRHAVKYEIDRWTPAALAAIASEGQLAHRDLRLVA